jgi:hypothetical protein
VRATIASRGPPPLDVFQVSGGNVQRPSRRELGEQLAGQPLDALTIEVTDTAHVLSPGR